MISNDLYDFLREELTVARLRKVKKDGKAPHYILDLKGAKAPTAIGKTERPELESIKLSKSDFYRLLPFAIAGSTRKRRYIVKGEVLDFKQQVHKVRAQIDVWKRAKCWRKFQRDPSRRLDVVTIDVELERRDLVVMLRAGNASFHFLYLAKELTALPQQVQVALSNRRLARRGFDHFARKTIKRLLGKRHKQKDVRLSLVPPYKPIPELDV